MINFLTALLEFFFDFREPDHRAIGDSPYETRARQRRKRIKVVLWILTLGAAAAWWWLFR